MGPKKIMEGLRREALESVQGISKAAITIALWIETLLLMFAIGLCLIALFKISVSESMTTQALELRKSALEQRDTYKDECNKYKELYNNILEELDSQRLKN